MDCWHHEIDKARTEDEVVKSAADFLALWAPQELAPVTLGWRELRIESGEDIELVKRWSTEGFAAAPYASPLHELARYFWHAAGRVEEIRSAQ
jgi:hypothetical protein